MATKANLIIDQGATYVTDLTLTDENGGVLDLSGVLSTNGQIRKAYSSANSVAFATAWNVTTGTITLSLTANQTGALEAGRYVYDVRIADANTITRIVEGVVTVTPDVTR